MNRAETEAYMGTLARRVLPEDPKLRAFLIGERLREAAVRQCQIVTCWICHAEYPEGSDGYVAVPGLLAICTDENDCNERAVGAGLVPVLGEPGTGGAS